MFQRQTSDNGFEQLRMVLHCVERIAGLRAGDKMARFEVNNDGFQTLRLRNICEVAQNGQDRERPVIFDNAGTVDMCRKQNGLIFRRAVIPSRQSGDGFVGGGVLLLMRIER